MVHQQQQIQQADERALGEQDEAGQEHAQPLLQLQRVVRGGGGGRGEGVGGGGGRGPSGGEEFVQIQSPAKYEEVINYDDQSSIPDILTEDPAPPSGDSEVCPGQI